MTRGFLFIAAVIGLLLYSTGLDGPFWLDDGSVINISKSFGWSTRPLGFASFWLNHHVMLFVASMLPWKEPFYFRLVNVLIHALAAAGVFWLTRELTGRLLAAAIAGTWFLVHPIQTQAVIYITQRFESLAAMFMLFSAAAYVRFRTTHLRKWLIAAAVFAAGAALTKETAIILPVWLLLIELVFFGTKDIRRRILYLVPLGLILLIPAWRAFSASRTTLTWVSWDRYFISQGAVLAKYLELSTWPRQQFLFYDFNPVERISWLLIGQWVLVLVVIGFGLYCLKRNRVAGFGILSFFILLLPVTVLPLPDMIVEHRLYPAVAGIAIAVAAAVASFNRKSIFVLTGVLLVLLGMKTQLRNSEWNDPIAFLETHRAAFPQDPGILSRLAAYYYNSGYVNRALELNLEARKYEDRANTYYRQIGQVLTAVNLATIYYVKDDLDAAKTEALRALAAKPTELLPMRALGNIQLRRREFEDARRTFEKYVATKNDYDAWNGLRIAAAAMGDTSTVARVEQHLEEEQKKAESERHVLQTVPTKYKTYVLFGLLAAVLMFLALGVKAVWSGVQQLFREQKSLKPPSNQQSSGITPEDSPPTL